MGGSDGVTCRINVIINIPIPPAIAKKVPPIRTPRKIIARTIINSIQNINYPPKLIFLNFPSYQDSLIKNYAHILKLRTKTIQYPLYHFVLFCIALYLIQYYIFSCFCQLCFDVLYYFNSFYNYFLFTLNNSFI